METITITKREHDRLKSDAKDNNSKLTFYAGIAAMIGFLIGYLLA